MIAAERSPVADLLPGATGGWPIRILHLEDEPQDAELILARLNGEGIVCDTTLVTTREAFVEALDRGGIDLILSDYSLPSFDGLTALAIARDKAPDVPFILVSGAIGEEAAIESLRSGATDYVLKHRLSRLAPSVVRALEEAAERKRRREAELALERERRLLKAILDSIDTEIVACDNRGELLLVNRASRESHALPGFPLLPDRWVSSHSLYHPDCRTPLELMALPLFRALGGEIVRNVEIAIMQREGDARRFLNSGQPILNAQGEKLGAVAAMHDITEYRCLEEQFRQAQKMEAVGRLAGGVAHDFNNILSVILGYGEMLVQGLEAEEPHRSRAEQIMKAAERASVLTRQLLLFSRKESVTPKVLDLNAILEEMDKMLLRLVGEDIEFVTHLEPNLWRVKVDPTQIEQVLMNLVVNARDAMPRGGKITFETSNVREWANGRPGECVMLAVSDAGSGMTPEVLSRAFEPFFTTKGIGKGTGLGLATVHGIVKQASGDICVHSEPGQGTTFRVYLPRVDEPTEVAVHPEAEIPLGGKETVLVLEDEASVRDVIRVLLEAFGYKVLEAADSEEAIDVARAHENEIQLLLTDVILPGIGGREAAERMTALLPGIKVLFMSGYTNEAIADRGGLAPDVPFLQKPFGSMELVRKIQEVLSISS